MITNIDIEKLKIPLHGLLRLQLKSYFKEGAIKEQNFTKFLEAISSSYEDYEEQLRMSQMAYAINAQELYEFNMRCSEESQNKKAMQSALNSALRMMNKALIDQKLVKSEKLEIIKKVNLMEELAQRIMQQNLEQENKIAQLDRHVDYLNGYAHMVSHELKSPLQNINTLLQWVVEGEADNITSSGKENLHAAMDNVERINKLLIDILTYYSIGNHKGAFPRVNVDRILNNLIEKCIPDHIKVYKEEGFPTLIGCRYGIEIVFSNIISNAVQAIGSKQGNIKFLRKDLPDHYEFSIIDDGPGVPEKYQKKIFEMFQKLDKNSSGSGLGLPIAKGVVMVLGGTIDVISKENEGAIFTFTISKHLE